MADEMMLMLNDDGVAHIYDETYDIVIHCESAEKQKEVEKRLMEMRWIPCSERLPSEGENVFLCDTRFGNVAIGRLIRYNTSCCWEVDHWDCDIEDWQAWMLLPEPWKGEGNEQTR